MDSTNLADRLAKLQLTVENINGKMCEFIIFIDAGVWKINIMSTDAKCITAADHDFEKAIAKLEEFVFADSFAEEIKKLSVKSSHDNIDDLIIPKPATKSYLN